ncbi:NACHT domain- and WD repeat-containing protein 1 isoform X2 [Metopolophium dirhodum]|uniref:NACHT domain- and WD repeat-containing protein 1 isoform X2 n=1 Tax=Metopolophium dirhodum TaxID=44670 RepID=UPI00299077C2|nr:NACHT domain- and WD repeat-containing protein 1 isoform X2 [Metopolophium dirhodum]
MGNYCSSKQKDGGGGSDEYLQKARYKKTQRKADKSTNVISVPKKGKRHPAASAVGTTTATNSSKAAVASNCNVAGVTFIIPRIEQPDDQSTAATIVCKPFEPNNISSSIDKTPEKCFAFILPDELKDVSTETKKLLLGVFESTANQKTNKIIVYICVPDNKGFPDERQSLYNTVLPAIRSKCTKIGYELHVVDLYCDHQQQQEYGQLDTAVRLAELRRQNRVGHVVPIVFVDDSLGPPVLPHVMTKQDFDLARSKAPDASKLIEKWYTLDAQKNHYELRNEMMFETTFETQEADEKLWHDEKVQLQIALMKTFDSKSLRSGYVEQVFQQEVRNEIILNSELAKRSVWIINNYDVVSGHKCKTTAVETKKRLEQLSKQLKNELPETNIIFYETANAPEFLKKIGSVLTTIVESVDKEREKQEPTYGVSQLLLEELRIQAWFGYNAAKRAVRRDDAMERAKKYLMDADAGYPLILYGPSGSGKTTVMAAITKHCHLWNQDSAVVVRFANASAYSSSLEQALHSLVVQLNLLDSGKCIWFKHDVQLYSEQIIRLLGSIGSKRPVTLIVDGVDRFENNLVDWIPQSLPNNVKIVVSASEPSVHLNRLRQTIKTPDSYIRIANMTDEQIDSLLSAAIIRPIGGGGAETNKTDGKLVAAKTPLEIQVSLLCSKIRNSKQPPSPEKWVEAIFDNVESHLGKDKVSSVIGHMCATRYGLLDSELVELLSSENEFRVSDLSVAVISPPAGLFWAMFNELMSSFLYWFKTDRYATVRWKNAVVAEAAGRRYSESTRRINKKIISYYDDQVVAVTEGDSDKKSLPKRRKLDECIHLTDPAETIKEFFSDLDWVLEKLNNGSVLQLLDELSAHAQDPQARFLRDFLSSAMPAVMDNGNQLFSQMSLYQPAADRYRALMDAPPFPTLMPLVLTDAATTASQLSESTAQLSDGAGAAGKFDLVKRFNDDANYVITVSTGRKEISVWDVHTCMRVRTLKGILHPTALKLIDNQRCIVLCERKLIVINLATGKVISKLKGVMNQNMPYFGLHSSSKIVALARSRMHVNLIDIETGTIEAYFKAGEDRFLNSLLVSGNGRVMVCGDETQKPFPLLVWNLTSRQLMYDLRIPFHEFVTRLAAITYEGHYVCCVAQEVDEPGPNFIVVYDLQSGTLFKKWKPGMNCVALDISSKDGCVLSGHENGHICIWDLTTGNCRWTLSGHVAPVTSLRLDPAGGSFVSLDTHARDRTIKLWNVTTGQLVSEFTPVNPITAFEILPGGEFVVVASLGSAHPTVLQLRGPQQSADEQTTTTTYGGETTLEVDLSLDFRDDAAAASAPAPVPTSAAVSR